MGNFNNPVLKEILDSVAYGKADMIDILARLKCTLLAYNGNKEIMMEN